MGGGTLQIRGDNNFKNLEHNCIKVEEHYKLGVTITFGMKWEDIDGWKNITN